MLPIHSKNGEGSPRGRRAARHSIEFVPAGSSGSSHARAHERETLRERDPEREKDPERE